MCGAMRSKAGRNSSPRPFDWAWSIVVPTGTSCVATITLIALVPALALSRTCAV